MGVALIVPAFWAAVVYLAAPWWGAEASRWDRRVAAVLTVAIGGGLASALGKASTWGVLLVGILAVVAVVDRRHRIIPNRLVVAAGLWAIGERIAAHHWLNATILAVAIFLFYFMVHVVTHGGLGMGDVKFATMLAFALGYPAGLVSMVAGIWGAGIYAVFLLVARRRGRADAMALGPFLAFGGLIGLLDLLH